MATPYTEKFEPFYRQAWWEWGTCSCTIQWQLHKALPSICLQYISRFALSAVYALEQRGESRYSVSTWDVRKLARKCALSRKYALIKHMCLTTLGHYTWILLKWPLFYIFLECFVFFLCMVTWSMVDRTTKNILFCVTKPIKAPTGFGGSS